MSYAYRRATRAGALTCALLLVVATLFADDTFATGPREPSVPDLRLMDPMKEYLSGRSWLILEGLDPALYKKPGFSPLTGMDWRSLSGTGLGAPTMQAAGGFMVPYREPGPAFSRDVLITRDFSSSPIQTEPTIAVHPDDSDHIVVAAIDYNFPSSSSYVSLDAGQTWQGPIQTGYLPDDLGSGGDPVLAFDRRGNLYMTSISIGYEEFSIGPVFTSSLVSSIAVSRSQDGGFSWPFIVSTARSDVKLSEQQIDPSGRLRGNLSIGFLDKPWIAVGQSPTDRAREIIYVVYVDFIINYQIIYSGELPLLLPRDMESTIRLVSSSDQGLTWTDPLAVGPTVKRTYGDVGDPTGAAGQYSTDRVVQGPRPVVDASGTLHVVWMDSTDDGSMEGLGELHHARSVDGGKTFSAPTIMTVFNELPFRPRNAYFRYWGSAFPRVALGTAGELYVVYTGRPAEKTADDGDIFFIRSTDGGRSWSKPITLNGDDGQALQFFPEIAVSPDGAIHVMWGDMRDDPMQVRYHVYYTSSTDGGKTWGFEMEELRLRTQDVRVSDFASNTNRAFPYGLFLGDYWGIAAVEDDIYMVWSDARLAEFGGFNQKIAFARKRAIRSPDIFITPSAGAGGQAITIQGFNFQPDMNVTIQMEDAVIAMARTNRDGRFTTGIYIPVTGEGPQSIRVYDDSGNFASTSFYTEFGFGTIQDQYQKLLDEMRSLRESLGGRR